MGDHLGFSTPTHHIFKQKYVFSILGFFFSKFKIRTTHTKSWCGCCVDFWVFGRVLFRSRSRGLRAKVFDKFYDSTCRWRRCWLHFTIWQNNYFSDPVYTMHWVLFGNNDHWNFFISNKRIYPDLILTLLKCQI